MQLCLQSSITFSFFRFTMCCFSSTVLFSGSLNFSGTSKNVFSKEYFDVKIKQIRIKKGIANGNPFFN